MNENTIGKFLIFDFKISELNGVKSVIPQQKTFPIISPFYIRHFALNSNQGKFAFIFFLTFS